MREIGKHRKRGWQRKLGIDRHSDRKEERRRVRTDRQTDRDRQAEKVRGKE